MKTGIISAFENGDFAEVLRLMDAHFGMHSYSLTDLFRDEQRRIVNFIMKETIDDSENAYRLIYTTSNILMGFLREAGIPVPKIFLTTAEFILNSDLGKAFTEEKIEEEKIHGLVKDIQRWDVSADSVELEFRIRRRLEEMLASFSKNPSDAALMGEFQKMLSLSSLLPFGINLWEIQNIFYTLSKTAYAEILLKAKQGDDNAPLWVERFKEIGRSLLFNIETVLPEG